MGFSRCRCRGPRVTSRSLSKSANTTLPSGDCCHGIRARIGSATEAGAYKDLFVAHGPPEHIRSDNGPEFVARNVRGWLGRIGVKTLYIKPGSPWENGYCESLNSKLRDELLNGEIFTTLREAQVLIRTGDATTMPSGRIPRFDTARRPQKRSCRQHPVCPTLRFGQPRRWPSTAGF